MTRTPAVAALFGIAILTPWTAAAVDGPLKVVEGVARVGKTDLPAAHVTLRFEKLDSQGGAP